MVSHSSAKRPRNLGLSLGSALGRKNFKLVSDLLSSARDSEGKVDNKVMVTLLSARSANFEKNNNYVDFLLKELKVTSDNPVGQLETAVLKGDVDEVEALLGNSENRRILLSKNDDSRHQSFVLYAFSCPNIGIRLKLLRLLIDNGVMNPKALDKELLGNLLHVHLTFFSNSCNEEEILDVIALLVDAGVSLEETDYDGRTALHICAKRKLVKVVSFLINDKNVNVNVKTKTGCTPLHFAVMGRGDTEAHLDIIKLLLSKGADINAKDDKGATALLYAKKFIKSEKTIEFLLQNGAYTFDYSPFGDVTSTREQKEIMIKIKEKLKNGETLLKAEQEMMSRLIRSYGMTLESKDNTD